MVHHTLNDILIPYIFQMEIFLLMIHCYLFIFLVYSDSIFSYVICITIELFLSFSLFCKYSLFIIAKFIYIHGQHFFLKRFM